jgi:hypothetical protein
VPLHKLKTLSGETKCPTITSIIISTPVTYITKITGPDKPATIYTWHWINIINYFLDVQPFFKEFYPVLNHAFVGINNNSDFNRRSRYRSTCMKGNNLFRKLILQENLVLLQKTFVSTYAKIMIKLTIKRNYKLLSKMEMLDYIYMGNQSNWSRW